MSVPIDPGSAERDLLLRGIPATLDQMLAEYREVSCRVEPITEEYADPKTGQMRCDKVGERLIIECTRPSEAAAAS